MNLRAFNNPTVNVEEEPRPVPLVETSEKLQISTLLSTLKILRASNCPALIEFSFHFTELLSDICD